MARPSDAAKDRELIRILSENARLPLSEIAKTLGVARATVQGRLARLERDGVIAGYTTILGKAGAQARTISALVLIELEVKRQGGVIAALKKRPEIVACHTLSGHFDLSVKVECETASDLDAMIDWIAELDGVRRTTSSVILAQKFER
ncbi:MULTISPECIES: Lrp/AsnC family transcriptional regulator [unclassified Bosea (in: a-proteobacteria)]|uniref:Lrp/AsnC family transcriptional regulator n=1 Tax=unclassified Bosea (in: a-proteobacteria) TaxID=2653178 RepID=UPI00095481A9|nr:MULTISPECIES: Lrp/AsnC family transcriptional regulator [unclassified Bosea (in: a-proteobacteria)]TAJ29490.1 MAG: Lrp/AsnC family transcriptional regulator [Bosea sp. (in: a-proteobacteria)]SIR58849.1 transcriptional regulator, AsnC family [Bosea sp. TND4EK4]